MDSGSTPSTRGAPKITPWNDPAQQPVVRFEGVTKRYGTALAVDRLSLDIFPGEFFALLGPSGCGKTTLLRLLAGFETLDEGRILLDGADIAAVPPHRRPVNMMFQSYALFPHLTVAGNIAFGLRQEGLPRADINERVDAMMTLLQLSGLGGRRPSQLSGGQRQRVALARSLVKRPRVLLLDEPLAALDRKLREETQFELMELQSRLGLTFVIVTHDQEEAMKVADRMGVMNHGRLVQVAPPEDIYEKPNSRWVADFIGDVNLIEGRVTAVDAGVAAIEVTGGVRFRVGATDATKVGAAISVAVRPEKIAITPGGNAVGTLDGEVVEIGYRGGTSLYMVRLDNGLVLKVATANTSRQATRSIGWNDRVGLSWAADAGVVLTQ